MGARCLMLAFGQESLFFLRRGRHALVHIVGNSPQDHGLGIVSRRALRPDRGTGGSLRCAGDPVRPRQGPVGEFRSELRRRRRYIGRCQVPGFQRHQGGILDHVQILALPDHDGSGRTTRARRGTSAPGRRSLRLAAPCGHGVSASRMAAIPSSGSGLTDVAPLAGAACGEPSSSSVRAAVCRALGGAGNVVQPGAGDCHAANPRRDSRSAHPHGNHGAGA